MAASCETGVVDWQVAPGQEALVPIHYAVSGVVTDDDPTVIIWGTGFGQPVRAAGTSAEVLANESGLPTVAIRLPFTEIARKANDAAGVAAALDRFIENAPHAIAQRFAPGRTPLLGGHSISGPAMAIAAATGDCHGLGLLSPAALNSPQLGKGLTARQLAIFNRLVVKTAVQNWRDPAMYGTLAGGLRQLMGLVVSGRLNPAFEHGFGDRTHQRTVDGLRGLTARGIPWLIFNGHRERCFPTHENTIALGSMGCNGAVTQEVLGPHACMDGRGRHQLVPIGQWFGTVAQI